MRAALIVVTGTAAAGERFPEGRSGHVVERLCQHIVPNFQAARMVERFIRRKCGWYVGREQINGNEQ